MIARLLQAARAAGRRKQTRVDQLQQAVARATRVAGRHRIARQRLRRQVIDLRGELAEARADAAAAAVRERAAQAARVAAQAQAAAARARWVEAASHFSNQAHEMRRQIRDLAELLNLAEGIVPAPQPLTPAEQFEIQRAWISGQLARWDGWGRGYDLG